MSEWTPKVSDSATWLTGDDPAELIVLALDSGWAWVERKEEPEHDRAPFTVSVYELRPAPPTLLEAAEAVLADRDKDGRLVGPLGYEARWRAFVEAVERERSQDAGFAHPFAVVIAAAVSAVSLTTTDVWAALGTFVALGALAVVWECWGRTKLARDRSPRSAMTGRLDTGGPRPVPGDPCAPLHSAVTVLDRVEPVEGFDAAELIEATERFWQMVAK